MREISDARIESLEDLAWEAIAQVRAFFSDQTPNEVKVTKAKLAVGIIGGYARLRASETNRMAIELAAQKMVGAIPPRTIGAGATRRSR